MSDPHVYHYVLTHDGRDVERIATRSVEPELVARAGWKRVRLAVELERRQWAGMVLRSYGSGWSVRVVRERGYVRSLYPGAALQPRPEGVISVSGQKEVST